MALSLFLSTRMCNHTERVKNENRPSDVNVLKGASFS